MNIEKWTIMIGLCSLFLFLGLLCTPAYAGYAMATEEISGAMLGVTIAAAVLYLSKL